jgi:hypothetical protein
LISRLPLVNIAYGEHDSKQRVFLDLNFIKI